MANAVQSYVRHGARFLRRAHHRDNATTLSRPWRPIPAAVKLAALPIANILLYLPRRLDLGWLVLGLVVMAGLHAWTFYSQGGEIQRVGTSKTNTGDIRSATIVEFAFGIVLLVFKEWSHIPMSTTWVFLGLLAGREIAMSARLRSRPMPETLRLVRSDGVRIAAGLAVSVLLALPCRASAR